MPISNNTPINNHSNPHNRRNKRLMLITTPRTLRPQMRLLISRGEALRQLVISLRALLITDQAVVGAGTKGTVADTSQLLLWARRCAWVSITAVQSRLL